MADIPAIFFCIGSQITPDREKSVMEAIRRGFLIGNHSWSHPSFETLAIEEATDEITRTEQIIERLYHEANVPRPIRLFRFPYLNKGGRHRVALQELLRKMGFRQPRFENLTLTPFDEQPDEVDVSCTYDTMDWTVANGSAMYGIRTLEDMYARMDEDVPHEGRPLNYGGSSNIVMMHDDDRIAHMFPLLIQRMLAKGIKFRRPYEH